jgi:hypothetical protein
MDLKEKIDLEKLLTESTDWSSGGDMQNTGAVTGAIGSGYSSDTITLSSPDLWSSASHNNTIVGGGYAFAFANTVSVTGGPYTINNGVSQPWTSQPWYTNSVTPKIKLDGEGADIEVNGWSLIDAIKKIEQRLNILTPNENLESEWEELRTLGEQYRKLEQHILDKQATWDKLKAMPPPVID